MEASLAEKLKKKGLVIAEKHLIMSVDNLYEVAEVVVQDTSTPLDDTFLEGLKMFKSQLKEFADALEPSVDSHKQ